MRPVILEALKDYRLHHICTKFYPDIPELANEESLQKTLNELIFAFEQWDGLGYDKDVDYKRICNGFRLFGKLFQYF
jgi:hypothetical protein